MKKDDKQNSDRVALVYSDEVSIGCRNVTESVTATEDWLEVSNGLLIPWDWIDRAREVLREAHFQPATECSQRIHE